MMTARAVCPTSLLALFAWIDRDGRVIGVTNGGDHGPPTAEPDPRGNRYLPLYGDDVAFDLATEIRDGPAYVVEADRVIRSYVVRPKTATELLREISWWSGALHSSRAELVSPAFKKEMSPAAFNDAVRARMVHGAEKE